MKNKLKEARLNNNFTQTKAANFLNVSLRSYKSYELDTRKENTIKYEYMLNKLIQNSIIDEEHGLQSIENIKDVVSQLCKEYKIKYCYLFGSYAKRKQKDKSDIDLLISNDVSGIKFYGLVEKLRTRLNKKIDLLDTNQLNNNPVLLDEILKEGIKIYG